jgi:hypothetical protein
MWLRLNFLNIRAPHASFRLKPEATKLAVAIKRGVSQ